MEWPRPGYGRSLEAIMRLSRGERGFALWDLVMAVCFLTPIGPTWLGADISKAGFAGHALAVLVGLLLGTSCCYAMYGAARLVESRRRRLPDPTQERYFRALYFAAALWMTLAWFLGFRASLGVIRLLS